MIRIFLVGYMGAGKTTLGKALAHALGISFVDLDWYIEERFHQTISELFHIRGEAAFRQTEREMLHEAAEFENVIISTGGGTPCFFDNMEFMNRQGQTLFLNVAPEVLFRRLRIAKQQRPILQGKSDEELRTFIDEALAARIDTYRQAHYQFDAGSLESRSQIAQSVQKVRQIMGV
ncbi:MAG: shikimate kinase [Prevotellaceae bacterium]|jgi:shikimate kinase|nr:shikimate kinase [Prevotellaceae bacterium]